MNEEHVRSWCAILIDFNLDQDRLLKDTKLLVEAGYRGEHLNQLLIGAYTAEETGLASAQSMIAQFVRIA